MSGCYGRWAAALVSPPMEISGASAVVTGGASGLGEATVRRLVGGGAKVVILDRDTVKGEALAKELGEAAAYSPTDVTIAGDVAAAIEAVLTTTPRSPVSVGSVAAIAAAARRSTLKVPIRLIEMTVENRSRS